MPTYRLISLLIVNSLQSLLVTLFSAFSRKTLFSLSISKLSSFGYGDDCGDQGEADLRQPWKSDRWGSIRNDHYLICLFLLWKTTLLNVFGKKDCKFACFRLRVELISEKNNCDLWFEDFSLRTRRSSGV